MLSVKGVKYDSERGATGVSKSRPDEINASDDDVSASATKIKAVPPSMPVVRWGERCDQNGFHPMHRILQNNKQRLNL